MGLFVFLPQPSPHDRSFATRLFLLLFLFTGSACTRETPSTTAITIWRPVETWSGQASQQTEAFTSNTGTFRIHWTSENLTPGEPGQLKVTLHSAVSGRPLVGVAEHRGPGDDTSYVSEDPREFFLVVDAERSRWTLEVDEGLPGTQQEPARR